MRSRTGGPVCFYCGRQGHIKKFCDEWLKKVGEEQPENKKGPEIANFSHQVEYDSDVECIALISEVSGEEKRWIVDSAASHHLSNSKCNMTDLKRLRHQKRVKVGNGKYVYAKHEGSVKILVKTGNSIRYVKLHNVLFVPKLKFNLVSVSKSAEHGKKVEFVQSRCRIVDITTGQTVVTASKVGELYYLDCVKQGSQNVGKKVSEKEMEKALLSIKENSFKEEMLKRLKSIEEDKCHMQKRLDDFEKDRHSNESYSFKEEKSHNQVERSRNVMSEVVYGRNYAESETEEIFKENIIEYEEESDQEDSYENDKLESRFVEIQSELSHEEPMISCHEEQDKIAENCGNNERKGAFSEFISEKNVQDSAADVFSQEDNDLDPQEDGNDVDIQEDSLYDNQEDSIQEDSNESTVSTIRSVRTSPPSSRPGFKKRLQCAFRSQCFKIAKRCSVLTK